MGESEKSLKEVHIKYEAKLYYVSVGFPKEEIKRMGAEIVFEEITEEFQSWWTILIQKYQKVLWLPPHR